MANKDCDGVDTSKHGSVFVLASPSVPSPSIVTLDRARQATRLPVGRLVGQAGEEAKYEEKERQIVKHPDIRRLNQSWPTCSFVVSLLPSNRATDQRSKQPLERRNSGEHAGTTWDPVMVAVVMLW